MQIAVPGYIVPCRMTITRQIDQMATVERENACLVKLVKSLPKEEIGIARQS